MCRIYMMRDLGAGGPQTLPRCCCQGVREGLQPVRWDELRYALERAEKLVTEPNPRGQSGSSKTRITEGFIAIDYTEALANGKRLANCYALDEGFMVGALGTVVVARVPLGAASRGNDYVPPTVRAQQPAAVAEQAFPEGATEDEKIALAMAQARAMYAPAPRSFCREHPTLRVAQKLCKGVRRSADEVVPWAAVPRPVPGPHYVCYRCQGWWPEPHFCDDCPSHQIEAWRPMNQRRAPVGIPKSSLARVDPTDFDAVVAATFVEEQPDGRLWLWKYAADAQAAGAVVAVPDAVRQAATRPDAFTLLPAPKRHYTWQAPQSRPTQAPRPYPPHAPRPYPTQPPQHTTDRKRGPPTPSAGPARKRPRTRLDRNDRRNQYPL